MKTCIIISLCEYINFEKLNLFSALQFFAFVHYVVGPLESHSSLQANFRVQV